MSRAAVLLASSDEETRARLRLILDPARFEVREAEETDDVIFAVIERVPELVVLDLDLAGRGALAVARSLRAQSETSATRTLVLTPRGRPAPDEAPGVDRVLALPTTAFALLRAIDELLSA